MVNNPHLRRNVLSSFIRRDKLSKSQVMKLLGRSDHGNISNVCDWLVSQELIRMCFTESHGGRPEKFYQITHSGIVYLIENSPIPEDFWSTLISLVFYQKKPFSWQKIVELFDIYLQRYLKHYLKQAYYSPQLDGFNGACKIWYEKAIIQGETISLSQRVLEALAVNPGMTLDKIAQAVGEKVSLIEPIVKSYTVIPHTPVAVDVHGHYVHFMIKQNGDSKFIGPSVRLNLQKKLRPSAYRCLVS